MVREPVQVLLGGGVLTAGHGLLINWIADLSTPPRRSPTIHVVNDTADRGRRAPGAGPRLGAGAARRSALRTGVAPTGGALMEVVICPDSGVAAVLVADAIERLLRGKPDAVLGLATGSSPLGVYDELARRVRDGTLTPAPCARLPPRRVRRTARAGTTRATDR